MNNLHKDGNGVVRPIPCLDDSHLMNIIRLIFRPYSENEDKMAQYLTGVLGKKMTPEVFNEILYKQSFYIIDALRRESTRSECLQILAKFNPVFSVSTQIVLAKQLAPYATNSEYEDLADDFLY